MNLSESQRHEYVVAELEFLLNWVYERDFHTYELRHDEFLAKRVIGGQADSSKEALEHLILISQRK